MAAGTLTLVPPRLSGWAGGLLALLAVVPAASLGVGAMLWLWPGTLAGAPLGRVVFSLAKAWLLLGPIVWLWFVDRQRPTVAGASRAALGAGAALGGALGVLILGTFLLLRHRWIKPALVAAMAHKNQLDTWWIYVGFAVFECFVNALLEEYVWRWFVFNKCRLVVGARWAVPLSAALFTVHHVIGMAFYFDSKVVVLANVGVFAGGLIWSGMYRRYGSVWPGYVSHVLVDVAIFGIGAVIIFGR